MNLKSIMLGVSAKGKRSAVVYGRGADRRVALRVGAIAECRDNKAAMLPHPGSSEVSRAGRSAVNIDNPGGGRTASTDASVPVPMTVRPVLHPT